MTLIHALLQTGGHLTLIVMYRMCCYVVQVKGHLILVHVVLLARCHLTLILMCVLLGVT